MFHRNILSFTIHRHLYKQIPIREKYDPKAPQWTNIYVLIHFAVAVVAIEHMGKMSVSRTRINKTILINSMPIKCVYNAILIISIL